MRIAVETIEIPRGTVHQMWNPGPEPARVRWETSPAGRTEQWFRSVDRLIRDRAARTDKMPSPVAFATLLNEYRDVFRLATGPDWLLRPAIALLARLGRLRGYGP